MNIHVPQTVEAIAEAKELLSIPEQLMNAQNAKPVMGIVQDALLGAHQLTKLDCFLTRTEVMDLMMTMDGLYHLPIPAILKPEPCWTGKQIMSLILPPISMKSKELDLFILKGELLTGTLCKKTLGATSGGIIHQTCKLLSPTIAIEFMNSCQRLCNQFLETQGFSIGLDDCLTDEKTNAIVKDSIKTCLSHVEKVENLGKELKVPFAQREQSASRILGQVLALVGSQVQKAMPSNNAFGAMITSGSKGSVINIGQVTCLVSQQSIDSNRIMKKNHPDQRTLNYFPIGCTSVQARGFIERPFVKGLSLIESFFHNDKPNRNDEFVLYVCFLRIIYMFFFC